MNQQNAELNIQQSSYQRLEYQPSVSSISGSHEEKENLIKTSMNEAIGSFIFAFGIIASNNNSMAILIIFFLSMLISNRMTVFNPAVSFLELLAAKISFNQFMFNVIAQVAGAFLGCLTGYLVLQNWVESVPYLNARIGHDLLGSLVGEIMGSVLLLAVILIQEDQYLRFTEEKLEHALVITIAFGAARMFSFKGESLFNPAFAFSFEMFECIADGNWGRFGFLWMYLIGPFLGAVIAIIFDNTIYKRFYDIKMKHGF